MIQRLQVKRNEKGFTLIELLIVIIVLGILAAIVVFAVGSTRKDAVASACKTTVKSVELSAEAVNTNKGEYPASKMNEKIVAASNTLVVNNTASPANGALLRNFPSSSDYILQYEPVAPIAPATKVTAYDVRVYPGTFVWAGTTLEKVAGTPAVAGDAKTCATV